MKYLPIILFSLCVLGQALYGQNLVQDHVRLSVVSVRFMDTRERIQKVGINPSVEVEIRLRLENKGESSVFIYSSSNWIFPSGFNVEKRNETNFWYANMKDGWIPKSPGIGHFTSHDMAWIGLPGGSAFEWDAYEDTQYAGKLHAMSVLLKDFKDNVTEVFTDFYTVPQSKPFEVIGKAFAFSAKQIENRPLFLRALNEDTHTPLYFKLVNLDILKDVELKSAAFAGKKVKLFVRRDHSCDETINDWSDSKQITLITPRIPDLGNNLQIACFTVASTREQ